MADERGLVDHVAEVVTDVAAISTHATAAAGALVGAVVDGSIATASSAGGSALDHISLSGTLGAGIGHGLHVIGEEVGATTSGLVHTASERASTALKMLTGSGE